MSDVHIYEPPPDGANPKDRIGVRKPPLHLIPPAAVDIKCRQCGVTKSVAAFNRSARSINGRRSECRDCQRSYNARFRSREPLYNIWNLMMQRCYNPAHPAFRFYGARGIKVCAAWHDYRVFAREMSPRPSLAHSIDRIDSNGDYTPENCRWATQREQVLNLRSNRLIEVDGVSLPLAEWARLNGIPKSTVEARIYRYGWDETAAVTTPTRRYRKGDTSHDRRRNANQSQGCAGCA